VAVVAGSVALAGARLDIIERMKCPYESCRWLGLCLNAGGLTLGSVLGGCGTLNESMRMGSVELESFQSQRVSSVGPIDFAAGGDRPSVDSLERDSWSPVAESAGFATVQHYPRYTLGGAQPRYLRSTVRQRSAFPTAVSATQTWGEDQHVMAAAEGVAGPFWAASDLVLLIPRMFFAAPWEVTTSPAGPRQRSPKSMMPVRPTGAATVPGRGGAAGGSAEGPERLSIPQPASAP
jgi:hypothetical protein